MPGRQTTSFICPALIEPNELALSTTFHTFLAHFTFYLVPRPLKVLLQFAAVSTRSFPIGTAGIWTFIHKQGIECQFGQSKISPFGCRVRAPLSYETFIIRDENERTLDCQGTQT